MPTAIDQRLASLFHLAQIERVLRCEGIADDVEKLIRSTFKQIVRDSRNYRYRSGPALRGLLTRINSLLQDRFQRFAKWSHSSTVDCYARGIPRRWMRAINPAAVIRAGEDIRIDLPPAGYATVPNQLTVKTGRMTDEEWAAFLKKNIFQPPPPDKVDQIIRTPVAGVAWPERVLALSRFVQDPESVANQLRDGYAKGETIDQLQRRIQPLADNWASSARRIARTEGLRIAETIQRESYDQLGDLMAGMQIVATLDERTRPAHRLWNGRIYWKDARKKPHIDEFPALPAGPNCRCISVPVMKPPREFEKDPALQADFRTASGDTIPDPSAYSDWFAQADVGRRMMAVGAKRYRTVQRLLGGAEPRWQDFVDADGKMLSVDQLRGETISQRNKRMAAVQQVIVDRMRLLGQVIRYGFTYSQKFKR